MRCKDIQELLKSDYLDGEAGASVQKLVSEHLWRCPQCRKLEQELLARRTIFQAAEHKKAPERVWQNIRDNIIAQELEQEARHESGILERLRELIFARRPAFALASAFAVLLFIGVFSGVVIQRSRYASQQAALESILVVNGNGSGSDQYYDLGTDIEQYFL